MSFVIYNGRLEIKKGPKYGTLRDYRGVKYSEEFPSDEGLWTDLAFK